MKKLGNIILVLVIILLIAAVGFGGWYFIKKDKESNDKIAELENTIASLSDKEENEKKGNDDDKTATKIDEKDTGKTANKTDENELIKKVLKDDKWLEENVYASEKEALLRTWPDNDTWLNNIKERTKIKKIKTQNGTYAYVLVYSLPYVGDAGCVVLCNNGEVKAIKIVTSDYAAILVGEYTIYAENDSGVAGSYVYVVENGKVNKFAEIKVNPQDDSYYYYVNGENVSYGRFNNYIEDCKELEADFINENIEKIVK